ncbi:MAG TPA: lysophospholipid acyltransferase family protein [Ktedonobacterales bacterium]|nr:lysophospholipid acyltransferase family protein [Ktedonobacterales bacterium]
MIRYWLVRIAAWIVPWIPLRVARPLALAAGMLTWAFSGAARRRAEWNLGHVPALAGDPPRIRRTVRGVFRTSALNYLDFLRGPRLGDDELLAGWTIENQEAFDTAIAQGRGLIVLGAHFGNFELAASRLGAMGQRLIIPVEHMRPERLFRLFRVMREHHGLHVVPADSREALRELLEALRRGEVAMFLADRYMLGASVDVPFFGVPARFASAPIALALRSGAPVLSAYSWREGPGRWRGLFVPLTLTDEGGREREREGGSEAVRADEAGGGVRAPAAVARARTQDVTARALRRFLEVLEQRVAAHPDQWVSATLPIWPAREPPAGRGQEEGGRA